jgi:signal transduction histidine kinase/CheY-like chemotaxis protein
MPLDPRTFAVASNLVGSCLTVLALLLWLNSRLYPGFGRWTLARLMVVFNILLSIHVGSWHYSVSVVLPDILGLLGLILSLEACREFVDLKPVVSWTYGLAAVLAVQVGYLIAVQDAIQFSYVEIGLIAAAMYSWIGATLLQNLSPRVNRGQVLTGLTFLVTSALYFSRSFFFLTHSGGTLVDASPWNIAFLIMNMLFGVVVNFSFFLMHYERLLADKAEEAGRTAAANLALTELKEHLEERIRKGTEELVNAQKMESIGRLAGGIAHDFNNMLTVILGYTAMLRGDDTLARQHRDKILQIEKAGLRSRDITNQLLGFSRRQMISPRTLDLNEALAGSRGTLSRLIGEDVELRLDAQPDLWNILFDATQIAQITMNLSANARDAMPHGGVLTMRTRNVIIGTGHTLSDGQIVPPGNYVELSVDDNGIGMDRDTLSHIFEPFFTTKPRGAGTGLGLATVYGIVRQNSGYISASSKPGGGSVFSILIPRSRDGMAAAEPGGESPLTRGAGSILVVEDNRLVREMIATFLTSLGYRPLLAEGPDTALRLCADLANRIDIMISDIVMPGMNGIVLAEQARAKRPGLKVLFMSGYSSHIAVRSGIPGGGAHFIQKPFTINALAQKIEEVIATQPQASALTESGRTS